MVDTLRSPWVTSGPRVGAFEKEFACYIGSKHALAVNSGTSGLHLALEAAGVREGQLVITTPYTFTATGEVIRYLGADPVLVDIDPATLLIDAERIQDFCRLQCEFQGGRLVHRASRRPVSAILPVHVAGLPCNMDAIESVAASCGLVIVEDAAHALPATCNGRRIGSGDHLCMFSFYATKPLTTGEGGMVTTNDDKQAERIRVMRLHGITQDVWDRYQADTPKWFYEVVAPGFKYNMPEVAAAMGLQQLKKVDRFHQRRKIIAERYQEAFENLDCLKCPKTTSGASHAWHLYIIRLKHERLDRDRFIQELAGRGIGTSVHFIPLHIHPYYRERYGFRPEDFPNALRAYSEAVSLPIYTRMTDSDVERVIEAVRSICETGSRATE